MNEPPPIVAFDTSDPKLRERIARYSRDLYRLRELDHAIQMDRIDNRYREGGWFRPPPPPIQTEARELEVLRLARELEHEREAIAALCPIWDHLGGTPTRPKGTDRT